MDCIPENLIINVIITVVAWVSRLLIDGYSLAQDIIAKMFTEKPRSIQVDLMSNEVRELISIAEKRKSRCLTR